MADYRPEELAQLQAAVDASPKAAQLRQQYGHSRVTSLSLKDVIGVDVPGYTFEPHTGKITKITNFPKEQIIPWAVLATMGIGSLVAGGAAPVAGSMTAPELGVDAIPSVVGGAATESASAYPFLAGTASGAGGAAASAVGRSAGQSAGETAANAALRTLTGLPALFANRDPSAQENAFTDQARRLLGQQEQRTQFQGPLYEAATRQAYNLLPNGATQGNPYPYSGLSDVNVPGLEDLLNAQRTAQRRS